MTDDWGWWAGRDESVLAVGPLPTKEAAVQEALDQGEFDEIETPEGWRRLVYFAECRGEYYDCGECGNPPKPCAGCRGYLSADELHTMFARSRNAGSELHLYEDDLS